MAGRVPDVPEGGPSTWTFPRSSLGNCWPWKSEGGWTKQGGEAPNGEVGIGSGKNGAISGSSTPKVDLLAEGAVVGVALAAAHVVAVAALQRA